MTADSDLLFPPLLRGEAVADTPFEAAVRRAREGTDAGLIVYTVAPEQMSAAIVLGPEVPLADAMAMLLAAANAFADAFGALAPSEVAAEFDWPGGIRINGARCGGFRAAASTADPLTEPDWLVIGIDVPFSSGSGREPGENPDRTTLFDEGCGEMEPLRLLESWSRHLLVWINEWSENGIRRLHRDWLGRSYSPGTEIANPRIPAEKVIFVGLDEQGGLIFNSGQGTQLVPLTEMLEDEC